MKLRITLALLLLACFPAIGGEISPDVAEEVLAEANKLRTATLEQNHQYVVDKMHPTIVEMMGGPEGALQLMSQLVQQMKDQGLEIAEYTLTRPTSLYEADTELVVFVPSTMIIKGQSIKVHSKKYLVASRLKEGGAWTFIDGSGINEPSALQGLFPGIPADFEVPETSQEVIQ